MQNLLLGLAALACPVGMGAMTLLVARGARKNATASPPGTGTAIEVASSRSENAELKAGWPVEPSRG